ncbi:hypothetical protein SGPA1_11371 [Streptomyces misionensis JCM 4497]
MRLLRSSSCRDHIIGSSVRTMTNPDDAAEMAQGTWRAPRSYYRALTKRTLLPYRATTGSMHHWHSGRPPAPYRWVGRWHPEHGPVRPGARAAKGSGSDTGGGAFSDRSSRPCSWREGVAAVRTE